MAAADVQASAQAVPDGHEMAPESRVLHRVRLAAVCVLLTALAFVQDPGRIAADTKLDLANDPAGFLARALHLWEPLGFFGQLQNQAYGYLFPVGPFFIIGDLSGLEPWVVQRLWWAAILVAAFLGVVRLSRMLGVASPIAGILAGLAYALAPRMVTEIGVVSVEVLPFAIAPWVAIPLVSAAHGHIGLRRAAALSGVALLFASGVNAVATVAVLPVGAWWILTQFAGRARFVMAGWWTLAVSLACLWWAVPLVILGRYSPPFLDWIESSSVTTLITSPDTVLRGASQWVAYVVDAGGPVWPAGWQLVSVPLLVFATAGAAVVGLTGLALRAAPYRSYLLGLLLMGLALVSIGHMGDIDGFGASTMRSLLDGSLAPLRNTHKFDLLLRLPLAIGVGFMAQAVLTRRGTRSGRTAVTRTAVGALSALVILGAWPLITGSAARDRSYAEIPDYWAQTASWLEDADPRGRALVVPGASFGVYLWGRTQDEPLQVLASTPWAVRDAVPLSSAGNIRWMDAVQERLDSGRGSPGLADALARAGVRYVVVRNDIDPARAETPRGALIRQALVRSGGFLPVMGFGPPLSPYRTDGTVIDRGLQDTTAAVEIWRVESDYAPEDARVWLRDANDVLAVSGAAESVIDLADAGVLRSAAVVTGGDEGGLAAAEGVRLLGGVTDGYLRTEVGVGRSRDNRSEAMTLDQEFRQSRRVHDFYPIDPAGRQAVAEFRGGAVAASSSGSDPTALRSREPSAQAWSAIDGDPATAWLSGDLDSGVGQWWEVVTDKPFTATSIPVQFLVGIEAGAFPAAVTVTTDSGEVTTAVDATLPVVDLPVPSGPTKRLRITLAAVADGSDGDAFGLREVGIPADVVRTIRTVGVADGGPVVLTARRGEQSSCVSVAARLVCSPVLGKVGEERAGLRRIVSIGEPASFQVSITGRPRPGRALDAQLVPFDVGALTATASSVATSDPASRAQSAVDGVLSTAWVAAPLDERPELVLSWGEPTRIRGVQIELSPDLPVSRPLTVSVFANGTQTTGVVSGTGFVAIPAQVTTTLRLRFDNSVAVRSLDPASGFYAILPLGVSDVRILGGEGIPAGPLLIDPVVVPCGFGPELFIDGVPVRETTVTTTVSDVLTDARLTATPCESTSVRLEAGQHEIEVMSTEEFIVESFALEPVQATADVREPAAPTVLEWGDTYRTVEVEPSVGPRLLETSENANEGWVATLDGRTLEHIRVDGWRQAWLVPAGSAGRVTLEFAPDVPFRTGLLVGLLGAIALVVLAVVGRRSDRRVETAVGAVPVMRRAVRTPGGIRAVVPVPDLLLVTAGLVASGLVAGWWGLSVGLLASGAAFALRRTWVVLSLGVVGAVAAATMPWPAMREGPAWIAATAALAAVAAITAATAPERPRRKRSAQTAEDDAPMLGAAARP